MIKYDKKRPLKENRKGIDPSCLPNSDVLRSFFLLIHFFLDILSFSLNYEVMIKKKSSLVLP